MYKLIAIDIDDTLLNDNLIISDKNIEALEISRKKGLEVVLCSGRPNFSIQGVMEKTGVFKPNDYIISYNGAIILKMNGEIISEESLEMDIVKDLRKIGKKYDVILQYYNDGKMFYEGESKELTDYIKRVKGTALELKDINDLDHSIKLIYNSSDIKLLEKIKKEIEGKYKNTINIFFSRPNLLEVLNINSNKGLAVERLAKKLGIKREEVITIGDSYNDQHMIEYAGLGVAVANAHEEIKKIADYVTENDNNNHAVWEVVEKFVK